MRGYPDINARSYTMSCIIVSTIIQLKMKYVNQNFITYFPKFIKETISLFVQLLLNNNDRSVIVETTLNIHIDILKKINRASKKGGIARSEVIILIIKKYMAAMDSEPVLGKLVQYQQRDHLKNWHTFHINLMTDDYEFLLDIRKLFKMPVSNIVAYAANKFLVSKIQLKRTDKNLYKNYIISKRVIDTIVCWKLFWGYTRGINKHLNYNNRE